MSIFKPLQLVCAIPTCRCRQTVPGDRIWFVTVKQGPGSHRAAGWICRACRIENITEPRLLPKGMLGQLPSREKVYRLAAASHGTLNEAANDQVPAAATGGPAWASKENARAMLAEALTRIDADGGDALALATVEGRFEPIEIASVTPASQWRNTDERVAAILQELEDQDAQILVLGGKSNGKPWQMILHAQAGAASFA